MQVLVQLQNQKAVTTSKLVANAFGKQHKHVLRDIETLECSEEFRVSNFGHTPFTHPQNKQVYNMYTITRDGFSFLAMGYTGKKAAEFKEAYINAFNSMENRLQSLPSSEPNMLSKIESLIETITRMNAEFDIKYNAFIEKSGLSLIESEKRYTTNQWKDKTGASCPSGYTSVAARFAKKWHQENKIPYVKNEFLPQALEHAFKKIDTKLEVVKNEAIEFLKKSKDAQNLKLLEVGEYMIFNAEEKRSDIRYIINLINSYTPLNYDWGFRKTITPSIKVIRLK